MKEIIVKVGSLGEGLVESRDGRIIGERWGTESSNKKAVQERKIFVVRVISLKLLVYELFVSPMVFLCRIQQASKLAHFSVFTKWQAGAVEGSLMFNEVEIAVQVVQQVLAKGRCVTVSGPVRRSRTENDYQLSFTRGAFDRDGRIPLRSGDSQFFDC